MSYQLGGEEAVPFSAHGADYVIRKSGGVYLAEGRLGNQDLHNTSLVALWNAIYGEVAEPTMQFTRGVFTVDDTLGIQAKNTVVKGHGEGATVFYAANSLDKNIFEWNGNHYYYNVLLQDFSIDGNKTNQAALSRGIEIDINDACTSTTPWAYLARLNNLAILDCHGAGLFFETTTGTETMLRVHDCNITGNGKATAVAETVDVQIERMSDGWITGNFFEAMILRLGISTCHFADNYYAGGGEAKVVEYSGCSAAFPAHGNIHEGDFFDNVNNAGAANSGCLSLEDYTWDNQFLGCSFGRNSPSSTANTAAQVQIIDDATHHKFLGCAWSHPSVLTRTFNYAIWEKDNADYNTYTGSISKLDRPDSGLSVYGTGYWNVGANSDVDGLRVV